MKLLVRMLLCLMISFSLVEMPINKAHAEMISTQEAVTQLSRTQSALAVAQFLDRSDVKDQMLKLGVSADEASLRLASLSDSEVQKLSEDIQKNTAGGSVVGILLVVLIVLGIIYLARRI